MKRRCLLIFIWLLSLIFYLYQYVARASIPNVLNNELMDYFQIDATQVCGLFSTFYLVYMLMQIPVGYLLDKFGTKYVSFYSVLSCAFGLFVFIITRNYYVAIIGQILVGIGSSFAFILSLKLAEEMFPANKLPMMSAILNSSGAFGAFFISPVVAKLSGVVSIKTIIYTMSLIGTLLAFLLLSFVHHKRHNEKFSTSNILVKLKVIVCNKQIIFTAIYSMLMYSVVVVFADHFGVSYMIAAFNTNIMDASWMCSMIYIGIIFGSPVFATIASYFKSYKLSLVIGSFSTFIIVLIILFGGISVVNAPIFMFFLGVSVSSQVMAFPAAMSSVRHEMTATTSSLVNTITTLSGVLIYPLVGFVMDVSKGGFQKIYLYKDFQYGFSVLLIALIFSIIISIWLGNSYKKSQDSL